MLSWLELATFVEPRQIIFTAALAAFLSFNSVPATAAVTIGTRIGVGTMSPATELHVVGTITTTNASVRGGSGVGVSPGLMVLVSSGSFTAATKPSVALPSQYTNFIVIATLKNVTGANSTLAIQFGNDAGAYYGYGGCSGGTAGFSNEGCDGVINKNAFLSDMNSNDVSGNAWVQVYETISLPDSSTVGFNGHVSYISYQSPSSYYSEVVMGGTYSGSARGSLQLFFAPLTACATAPAAATNGTTGTIYVYALPF